MYNFITVFICTYDCYSTMECKATTWIIRLCFPIDDIHGVCTA